jgi:hypothetical protein
MKTMRFWVGTGLLTAACVLIILAVSPGDNIAHTGRVGGRVTYQGRPLVGGSIFFFPDDMKRCDHGHADIDANGRYLIGPEWRREGPERTRFRICVILDQRKYPSTPRPAEGSATPRPDQIGAAGALVMTVSMGSEGLPFPGPRPGPATGSGPPLPRFSNPTATNLAVQLGPEPARIDIDLKD